MTPNTGKSATAVYPPSAMIGRMNSAPRTPMYLKNRETTKACSRNASRLTHVWTVPAMVPIKRPLRRDPPAVPAATPARGFLRDQRVEHEAAERVDQAEDEDEKGDQEKIAIAFRTSWNPPGPPTGCSASCTWHVVADRSARGD